MNKQELAEQLEALRAGFTGEAILYAPQRKPDRMPHRKKASLIDEAFAQVLEDGQALLDKASGNDSPGL